MEQGLPAKNSLSFSRFKAQAASYCTTLHLFIQIF